MEKIVIYELRTYRATPGKAEQLHRRFADHTIGLFAKHHMDVVGFWTPDGDPDTLVYLMRFDSRDAMKAAWSAFAADPAWKKVKADSEVDGSLVAGIKSEVWNPTAYSPAV
jgi:NIPSNAP